MLLEHIQYARSLTRLAKQIHKKNRVETEAQSFAPEVELLQAAKRGVVSVECFWQSCNVVVCELNAHRQRDGPPFFALLQKRKRVTKLRWERI